MQRWGLFTNEIHRTYTEKGSDTEYDLKIGQIPKVQRLLQDFVFWVQGFLRYILRNILGDIQGTF